MKTTSRREFIVAGTGAIALSAAIFKSVQGWFGEAGQLLGRGLKRPLDGPLTPSAAAEIDPVAHALNRFTFGPCPGDYARVAAMGVDAFLEEQLALATSGGLDQFLGRSGKVANIDDALCERAIARFSEAWWEPVGEAYEEDDESLSPVLRRVALLRAIYSKRQLFEVMCEFWSDHFNIDPGKGDCRYAKIADDQNTIRKHALGNFRDMVRASALSPAMLWYLDGRANVKRQPDEKPNENYARELMELHTLGVHGGYTQKDVMEVARCLTGWTILAKKDDGFSGNLLSPLKDRGKVVFRKVAHDDGPKHVLGHDIAAGLGEGDLDRVLDIVTNHPGTAQFIATKLCVRFISDEPPASAVAAVASAYTESKGDIKTMLRTLFATPEFRASAGAKFKRPFHFIVSALRATNAETDADRGVVSYLERMGQVPFRYPTPDGYPARAAHWHGTLLWRWKFSLALANNRINGTRIEREALQKALGGDAALMASFLNRQPAAEESDAFLKSGDGLALLLASPAFQRC
ncbi:MAG TPA: DUF1800 domain-containing protein [Chthoniobacteraceae bacterium]|nr:DUF1800 domain-containing protein [Chthoniobacteraceae bacterium]